MKLKGEIHTSYDGEHFYLGEHLQLAQAKEKWTEYDGEDSDRYVYDIEHLHYRTGFLPENVREDWENVHGWWIVPEKGLTTGRATLLEVKYKKQVKE